MRPTIAGFLAGSILPFAYGVQWLANDIAYHREMSKLLPIAGACGMGTLGALGLIVVIAPVCGAAGWASGWAFSVAFARLSKK